MGSKEPSPVELLKMFADGAKIRHKNWDKDEYVVLKGNIVIDDEDYPTTYVKPALSSILNGEYELYKEPKKLKRFWIWDIHNDGWYRTSSYLDEDGMGTCQVSYLQGKWHGLEKRKAEPEQFIDVEVES